MHPVPVYPHGALISTIPRTGEAAVYAYDAVLRTGSGIPAGT